MSEVWIVATRDAESLNICSIFSTKEKAERELMIERDKLVSEWQEMIDSGYTDGMYQTMIDNLSNSNYEKWANYPHECPYIFKMEVL